MIRVSNSLDPYQARRFAGPNLGPNCLQRLSTDDTIVGFTLLLVNIKNEYSGYIQPTSHDRKFPTMWYVQPANAQTSLYIRIASRLNIL